MNRRIFLSIYCLLAAIALQAQNLAVELKFPKSADLADTEFYLGQENLQGDDYAKMTADEKNNFTATIPEAKYGFYMLTTIRNGGQVNSILYIPKGTKSKELKAQLVDEIYPVVTNDNDCRILTTFAHQQGMRMRRMWTDNLSETQIRDMFADYKALEKQADPTDAASSEVKKYLEILAYSQCWLCLSNVPQVMGKKPLEVTVRPEKVLPSPVLIVDHPYSTMIPGISQIITDEMRHQRDLEAQLQYLFDSYKNQEVANLAIDNMLGQYIATFNYQKNYAKGLIDLGEATEKFKLDEKYLNEFRKRASTISGAEFPEGIELTDRDGKTQSFAQFRGKYVVLDLWASWCVPCCREVPYMQKLEAEMEGKDIVFLSISLDSSTAPWKKRMTELNMHGNQWLCTDAKLCESLNVNGIPMFLIYDKEGHLLQYDAPRPSDQKLKEILELLM